MRGYLESNPQYEYSRITVMQRNGIACPYCHADQGHFGRCMLLRRTFPTVNNTPDITIAEGAKVELYRRDIENETLKITEDDSIRLLGMGVLWDKMEDNAANANNGANACWHPIC